MGDRPGARNLHARTKNDTDTDRNICAERDYKPCFQRSS